MSRRSPSAATAMVVAVLATPLAHGAAQRTFVASTGLDTHPCSIAAPCRSFSQAATQILPKGEIVVLDSAGYGPVTITKSLSIIAPPGVYAGVTVFSGDGIVIEGAGIDVALRGLAINGQGGTRGIVVTDADRVLIENVVVSHMSTQGIEINAGRVSLTDVRISKCGAEGVYIIASSSVFAHVLIDGLHSEDNGGNGILLDNYARVVVRNSVIARNAGNGIYVFPDSGEVIYLNIENTTIAHNDMSGVAVNGGGGGAVTLSNNAILQALGSYGVFYPAGSSILVGSRQNNTFATTALPVGGGGTLFPFGPL